MIGTLPTQDDAATFGDYLLTIGLPNHIEEGRDQSWQIWIERDDDLEQGQLQLREYTANPNEPKYKGVASKATTLRQQASAQAERRRRNFKDVRTAWSGVPRHATIVTTLLVGISVMLYMAQQTKFGPEMMQHLFFFTPLMSMRTAEMLSDKQVFVLTERLANFGIADAFSEIAHGQVWRLITPALMHGGMLHLLFNCYYVMVFGAAIEGLKGLRVFLPLVLVAAVVSNSFQAIWIALLPYGGLQSFLGLSGINYALFGYVWMRGIVAPQERLGASQQTVGFMIAWLFICMTGFVGPIANTAHVVGLAVGVVFGAWPRIVRTIRRA